MALLPRLVGESRLGPANALLHTVQELGVVVGPGDRGDPAHRRRDLGGVRRQRAHVRRSRRCSSHGCADARRHAATAETERAASQLKQGFSTVWRTAYVVPIFLIVAMVELTYGAQTVQLVLYAEQQLGLGAEGYGYLLAAAGVGGLLSIVVNARLSTSSAVSRIVVGTAVLFCATQLVYARSDLVVVALLVTVARRHRTGRLRGRRRDDPRARGARRRARPRRWGSTTR